ncbi:MAG: FAD-dependent oxidoreductase, partial [Pseudomonadota bacterium]
GLTKTAKHILIATGGRPVRPQDLPNAHLGMVSDDIFDLTTLPKSLLIVGGGYIACEFACILAGLGVQVEMYLRGAQILNGFDDEARGLVAESMKQKGIIIHTGTNILDMAPASQKANRDTMAGTNAATDATFVQGNGPVWVKTTMGQEAEFDSIFFATGRAANTSDLGLEDAGISIGRRGEITVDEFSKTSVDHIYAIGDVTGRVELTPVAIREGMAFVETVFKNNPTPVDHHLIPTAVFTQPEVGTVGLTEEQAAAQEPIDVYSTSFRPMQGAFIEKADRVMMKLLVSQANRKVLGCHIVADGAGEMIQMAGIAVKMGATKEDFDRVCAVHPTMSEELVTMKTPVRSA